MSENLKKDILTAVEDGRNSSKGSTDKSTHLNNPQVLKHCLNKPFRHPQKLLEHLHKGEFEKGKKE